MLITVGGGVVVVTMGSQVSGSGGNDGDAGTGMTAENNRVILRAQCTTTRRLALQPTSRDLTATGYGSNRLAWPCVDNRNWWVRLVRPNPGTKGLTKVQALTLT